MLGKWATTQERVFFLGKNCSWTFLPGSTWLRMPMTRLQYISCLRSFRTHFDSLKHADDLWVYQGFTMPLNHQAGIEGTLKQCQDISWQSSNATHLLFCLALDRFTCCVHVKIAHVNNLFPDFRRYLLLSFDLEIAKILWNTCTPHKQSACLLFIKIMVSFLIETAKSDTMQSKTDNLQIIHLASLNILPSGMA